MKPWWEINLKDLKTLKRSTLSKLYQKSEGDYAAKIDKAMRFNDKKYTIIRSNWNGNYHEEWDREGEQY